MIWYGFSLDGLDQGVEWNGDVLTTYNISTQASVTRPLWLTLDGLGPLISSAFTGSRTVYSMLDRMGNNGNIVLNFSPT